MEDSEPDLPSSARGLEVVHPLKSGKMVSKQSASIDETNQHKLQQTQTLTHGVFFAVVGRPGEATRRYPLLILFAVGWLQQMKVPPNKSLLLCRLEL